MRSNTKFYFLIPIIALVEMQRAQKYRFNRTAITNTKTTMFKNVMKTMNTTSVLTKEITNERNLLSNELNSMDLEFDTLLKTKKTNRDKITILFNQYDNTYQRTIDLCKKINCCVKKINVIEKNMNKLDEYQKNTLCEKINNTQQQLIIIQKIPNELLDIFKIIDNKISSLSKKYTTVHYEHALNYMQNFATEYVVEYCKSKIIQLKGDQNFYIGATNNPDARVRDHFMNKHMSQMYVLCAVSNLDVASYLESTLIRLFCKDDNILNVCLNKNGNYNLTGGEGLVEGTNYIYLLMI